MKTITILSITTLLLFATCTKPLPVATFTTDKTSYTDGDTIHVTNYSVNADNFIWTVTGSASQLTTKNIDIPAPTPGTYTIKLTAGNGSKNDELSKDVVVNKATGFVMFYATKPDFGQIRVYLEGVNVGIITIYYPTAPDCNSPGCINLNLPEGNYNFTATGSVSGTWSGTVAITRNNCIPWEFN